MELKSSLPVIQALAVTAELTNTQLSPAAARVMAQDLAPYPEHQILDSLARCRKELKGRLTVSDIVSRLDDGRPGPEEAWSILPFDERQTVVWTEEMEGAWGVALPLIEDGDRIAARMAFLESYRRRVQQARDAAAPVKWRVSFGQDPAGRQVAIAHAVQAGRISDVRAAQLGYVVPAPAAPLQIAEGLAKRLLNGGGE